MWGFGKTLHVYFVLVTQTGCTSSKTAVFFPRKPRSAVIFFPYSSDVPQQTDTAQYTGVAQWDPQRIVLYFLNTAYRVSKYGWRYQICVCASLVCNFDNINVWATHQCVEFSGRVYGLCLSYLKAQFREAGWDHLPAIHRSHSTQRRIRCSTRETLYKLLSEQFSTR